MNPTTYTPKLRPTLAEAQSMLGGYVAMALDRPYRQVLVDEDGFAKELPDNEEASVLCGYSVVGNAIVLEGKAMWIDEDAEEDLIGEEAYP